MLKLLFGTPLPIVAVLSGVFCAGMILGGAPLLFWSHKKSLRSGSMRPIVFSVELMFLWGLIPFGYLLIETEGFDLLPFVGTVLLVLFSFAPLYWYQPKRVRQHLESARQNLLKR